MDTEQRPLRLVVVDDHQMVLDGLTAMLQPYQDRVEVIGTASTAARAITVLTEQHPDCVLLDVRLGNSSGLDLCAEILRRKSETKVVFLTVYDDEQYLHQALQLGAAGFLLKRVRGAELVEYLFRIHEGETLIDPAFATRVAMSTTRAQKGKIWPGAHLGITHRESEVLALLVAGLSNRAIAAKLSVGEETVKTHTRNIYRKLDVADRAGAITVALREGVFH